ncbi:MAG: exonuclease, partial [Clostridia bacterium]|nr:exonuclease [Clostridia bacterium]
TCKMARRLLPELVSRKLNSLCDHFGIELDHHNALSDARAAARLVLEYEKLGATPEKFATKYSF